MDTSPTLPPHEWNTRSQDSGAMADYGWAIPGVEREEACGLLAPNDVEQDLLERLESQAQELVDLMPATALEGLSDGGLIEVVRAFQKISNMIESKNVELTQQVTVRQDHIEPLSAKLGAKDSSHLLQDLTHLGRREIKSRLYLASKVVPRMVAGSQVDAPYPHLAIAFGDGMVSPRGAALIAGALDRAETWDPDLIDGAERSLVESATGTDLGSGVEVPFALPDDALRVACKAWEQALNPSGMLPPEGRADSRRAVNLGRTTADGLTEIRGLLTPQTAALLARLTDAINNPAAKTETSPESDKLGKEFVDERTASQKRHDAFAVILSAAAKNSETPTLGGAPAMVLIKVNAEHINNPDVPAWILDHNGAFAPVHSTLARHALCAGTTRTYLQNSVGNVEQLSTPQRVFTALQRKAILLRDGGCVIPGCTTPATWCEIHHITPHHQGGPTKVENGATLCWHHHRTLGPNGWEVRTKNGLIQSKPPPGYAQVWHTHHPQHKPPPNTGTKKVTKNRWATNDEFLDSC